MSYYYDIAVALKTKDWDDEIFPQLRTLFSTGTEKAIDLPMDDFIKKCLYPHLYVHRDDYTVLTWKSYNYWIYEEIHKFFVKITKMYKSDYLVINEDDEIEVNIEDLCIVNYQSYYPLVLDQPDLIESWKIINALVDTLENKHGYSKDDIRNIINKYTDSQLGDYFTMSLLK